MDEIVKTLRKEFKNIQNDANEGTVRLQVVCNCFLPCFGYDITKVREEAPMGKGFCDLFVQIDGENALIVEVKNGKSDLKSTDIEQVKRYADSKRQRFAILTNGYEYVLLDFKIESKPRLNGHAYMTYVVFWFNIFKAKGEGLTELRYLKYLEMKNIYINQKTQFFCDVAQYREWKLAQGITQVSWNTYRCTLYQFFDYYSRKVSYKKTYEKIDMDVFDGFIKERKREKQNSSIKTIEGNLTHLYNMLSEMKKHKKIEYISLSDSRKENLIDYKKTEARKTHTSIKADDVKDIVNFIKTRKNAHRDLVIFLLTVTLGLERSQLLNLQWDNFGEGYRYIRIDDRRIELPKILQECLAVLNADLKKARVKSMKLFHLSESYKYREMKEWNINDVFNNFEQIASDEKWKDYSPKFVRNCLIKTMYSSGYSLEDIMYITGIEFNNISKLITEEEMLQHRSKKINWKPLYNGLLCEGI